MSAGFRINWDVSTSTGSSGSSLIVPYTLNVNSSLLESSKLSVAIILTVKVTISSIGVVDKSGILTIKPTLGLSSMAKSSLSKNVVSKISKPPPDTISKSQLSIVPSGSKEPNVSMKMALSVPLNMKGVFKSISWKSASFQL